MKNIIFIDFFEQEMYLFNFTIYRYMIWAKKYNKLNKYSSLHEKTPGLSNWTRLSYHSTFTNHNAPAQIFVCFDTLNDTVHNNAHTVGHQILQLMC